MANNSIVKKTVFRILDLVFYEQTEIEYVVNQWAILLFSNDLFAPKSI